MYNSDSCGCVNTCNGKISTGTYGIAFKHSQQEIDVTSAVVGRCCCTFHKCSGFRIE